MRPNVHFTGLLTQTPPTAPHRPPAWTQPCGDPGHRATMLTSLLSTEPGEEDSGPTSFLSTEPGEEDSGPTSTA